MILLTNFTAKHHFQQNIIKAKNLLHCIIKANIFSYDFCGSILFVTIVL